MSTEQFVVLWVASAIGAGIFIAFAILSFAGWLAKHSWPRAAEDIRQEETQ